MSISGSRSIVQKAKIVKTAALKLANATTADKNNALFRIADLIDKNRERIVDENEKDVELASNLTKEGKLTKSLLARLKLNDAKIEGIIRSVKEVAELEDPVWKTQSAMELDTGLELFQVSCPIGVIGVIFESRPDALVQISSLCLKTGNAVMLKGGSEARNSNEMLFDVVSRASVAASEGIPEGWIQLLETREEVSEMLQLDEYIDLLVPRGSEQLVKYIQNNTRIMVLGHSEGVCHVYVDRDADMDMAVDICYDAKVQYPAVCNAVETLLVDEAIGSEFLPMMVERYAKAGVEVRGCPKTALFLGLTDFNDEIKVKEASEQDWYTEYNDLIISIKVIDGIDEAIEHINRYGSGHTDAIVTENETTARKFMQFVDSSSVMHNASTRFSDGYRYGKGAEVGISTNKVHARGPVGLDGLLTYKYCLMGKGHVVAPYIEGRDANAKPREFTHKKLFKNFF